MSSPRRELGARTRHSREPTEPFKEAHTMRNAIARWTPTGDVVRDRFGSLIEQAFNDMLRPFGHDAEAGATRTWIPRVDIRESADGLPLLMDAPGLTKDDLNITLE